MAASTFPDLPLTQVELARFVRKRAHSHVCDETGSEPSGTAIYTLSDPRDLREVRYVGQTRAPRRRFLQHIGTARLWVPDELPWWVGEERLRPLYEWLRELFRDERRLPAMVVTAWLEGRADATTAERALIQQCLLQGLPLLNIESATVQPQMRLL